MTRFSMFKRILFALSCAALCLNPTASLRADVQVPFKGAFVPTTLSVTPQDATHVRLELHVDVRATLLGEAQGPAFLILDLTTFTYVGEATWIAPNGDAIFTTFSGQFLPSGTEGILDNVETFQIHGGTGRFEGATGAGLITGEVDAATLVPLAPVPFLGTISSPGSLKQ